MFGFLAPFFFLIHFTTCRLFFTWLSTGVTGRRKEISACFTKCRQNSVFRTKCKINYIRNKERKKRQLSLLISDGRTRDSRYGPAPLFLEATSQILLFCIIPV